MKTLHHFQRCLSVPSGSSCWSPFHPSLVAIIPLALPLTAKFILANNSCAYTRSSPSLNSIKSGMGGKSLLTSVMSWGISTYSIQALLPK